jgi:hypothetical protein
MKFETKFVRCVLIVSSIMLSSCITTSDAYMPDGSLGHHITCGGGWFSMGDCIQKAGDICGSSGYTVVDKNGESIPFSQTNGYANSSSASVNSTSGSIIQRDLFVKCK